MAQDDAKAFKKSVKHAKENKVCFGKQAASVMFLRLVENTRMVGLT